VARGRVPFPVPVEWMLQGSAAARCDTKIAIA
jgi:hypothetical protein